MTDGHKFVVDQQYIFTDDEGSYLVKVPHRFIDNGDLGYRVEVLVDWPKQVAYCLEHQLSEVSDDQVSVPKS